MKGWSIRKGLAVVGVRYSPRGACCTPVRIVGCLMLKKTLLLYMIFRSAYIGPHHNKVTRKPPEPE